MNRAWATLGLLLKISVGGDFQFKYIYVYTIFHKTKCMLIECVNVYNSIACRLVAYVYVFCRSLHQCASVKIVVMQTCFKPPNDQFLLGKCHI